MRGLEIRLYASEIWAPQATSRDLAILEGVQRRATKFILQNYELSYYERLRKLNLLPISYWLEIKDLIFFSNANKASTTYISPLLSPFLLIAHPAPVRANTTCFKSIHAKPLFLETLFCLSIWNNLSPIIRNSSSVSSFKLQLHSHYSSQLDSSFDVNRMRTWKTYCSKFCSFNLSCCS